MNRNVLALAAAAALPLGLVTMVTGTTAAAVTVGASSSGPTLNPYSPAVGHPYRHGVVPTRERWAQMHAFAAAQLGANANPRGPLTYQGGFGGAGVTSGSPKIYLVFWGKQWGKQSTSGGNFVFSRDPSGGAPYVQNLFKGLGTGGEQWSGTMTQYCDGKSMTFGAKKCTSSAHHVGYPTGGPYAGVWYDNAAKEPAAASSAQLTNEAIKAAAHFGNLTQASNRYVQYDILSAPGLDPDRYQSGGFCAWHSWTSSPYGNLAFTNMPYLIDLGSHCGAGFVNSLGGTDDGYSIVSGHEYAETLTDQFPDNGWLDSAGYENGDICSWIASGQGAAANVSTATGTFAMQSTWSNDTKRCDMSHVTVP